MVKCHECVGLCVEVISCEGIYFLRNDATNSSPQPACALQALTELAMLMANVKEVAPL